MSHARGLLLDLRVVRLTSTSDHSVRPQAHALLAECVAVGRTVGLLSDASLDDEGQEWAQAQPWFGTSTVVVASSGAAVDRLGLPAETIVFIGDEEASVTTAREVGLRSVLIDDRDPAGAFREAVLQLALPWSCLP